MIQLSINRELNVEQATHVGVGRFSFFVVCILVAVVAYCCGKGKESARSSFSRLPLRLLSLCEWFFLSSVSRRLRAWKLGSKREQTDKLAANKLLAARLKEALLIISALGLRERKTPSFRAIGQRRQHLKVKALAAYLWLSKAHRKRPPQSAREACLGLFALQRVERNKETSTSVEWPP